MSTKQKKKESSDNLESMSRAVILNYGSAFSRLGFGGLEQPKVIRPTIVGEKSINGVNGVLNGTEKYPSYVIGTKAIEDRSILNMKYPIVDGLINDWAAFQAMLIHDLETTLRINPQLHPILYVDSINSTDEKRKLLLEFLFEEFQPPGVYITSEALMPVYATGRSTGLVIDSGFKSTNVYATHDGELLEDTYSRIGLGGYHITKNLRTMLREQGFTLSDEEDDFFGATRMVKEQFCYVAKWYDKEHELAGKVSGLNKIAKLPTGEEYTIGKERFMATELLFNPTIMKSKEQSIIDAIIHSIESADSQLDSELWPNIILTGGTSMIPGFKERVLTELESLAPDGVDIRVVSSPTRYYHTWQGASILSSRKAFNRYWVAAKEYDEQGLDIVERFS